MSHREPATKDGYRTLAGALLDSRDPLLDEIHGILQNHRPFPCPLCRVTPPSPHLEGCPNKRGGPR